MSYRRSGLNPLAYMGVEPIPLSADVAQPRDPNQNDINFNLSTRWLNTTAQTVWILVNLNQGIATWVRFAPGGGTGIQTVTGDNPVVVPPDGMGNLNVVGNMGVTVIGNAGTNTLTISGTGTVGTVTSVRSQNAVVVPPDGGGAINIVGTNGITTTGNAGTNTLTIVGSGGTVISITTQDNVVVPPDGTGTIHVVGAHGINTTGNAGTDTATVAVNNTLTLGDLAPVIGNTLTITTGDVDVVAGSIFLPNTNAPQTQGTIDFNNHRFISNFGTDNTFIGSDSGNTTLTVVSSTTNVGVGTQALEDLTTGAGNSVLGRSAGTLITSGSLNSALGVGALSFLVTGSENIGIGSGAGSAYTGAESSNIILGNNPGVVAESHTLRLGGGTGVGVTQQNRAFMSGVNGVTTASPTFVTIDTATDQLGVSGTGPTAFRSAFQYFASDQNNVTGNSNTYTLKFVNKLFDLNNDFDGVSTFTAPVKGLYAFYITLRFAGISSPSNTSFFLVGSNSSPLALNSAIFNANPSTMQDPVNHWMYFTGSDISMMEAGDTLSWQFLVVGSSSVIDVLGNSGGHTKFGGYLVFETL